MRYGFIILFLLFGLVAAAIVSVPAAIAAGKDQQIGLSTDSGDFSAAAHTDPPPASREHGAILDLTTSLYGIVAVVLFVLCYSLVPLENNICGLYCSPDSVAHEKLGEVRFHGRLRRFASSR